jgi:sulfate transport system permease protein
MKYILITVAVGFVGLVIGLPVALVVHHAFREGLGAFVSAIDDPAALASIELTLTVAAICVPLATLFGIAASWAIARFRFPGRSLLITLIDLPFAVSPVIAGMLFVLLFGPRGVAPHKGILFATPGIVLATLFVTFPFVARELIPLMEAQGQTEEEAAVVLGARGWQVFLRVTLPRIKWGLCYGVILCNARAMGEFGAVSVVSGHVRGRTATMPLQVQMLDDDYHPGAAFALASLLLLLALVTLAARHWIEWRARRLEMS